MPIKKANSVMISVLLFTTLIMKVYLTHLTLCFRLRGSIIFIIRFFLSVFFFVIFEKFLSCFFTFSHFLLNLINIGWSFEKLKVISNNFVNDCAGKSLSEGLDFASTNPQYDDRLFIKLQVQYMKIASSEHVVYTNCFLFLF